MVVGAMQRGFLSILLVSVAGLGFGQTGANQPGTIAGLVGAFRLVDSVIGRTFTYGIAGPDIPKEVKDILGRFDSAVGANKQWFEEYRKKFSAGDKPLPYDARFGISAEEYQRLQQLEKQPPGLVIIAEKNVTVARERNVLHFRGEDEARIFGYLEADLQQQRIIFAGDTLPFAGPMKAGQLAAFHLTQGYSWRFQKVDVNSTLQNYKVTARVIEIDMGVAADGGRTFFRIKYQDMKEGVNQADLDLTGFVI
ncbi:MAG: hypothetical protein JST42_16370 [Bacteroidetes bacterium]|nr:hypothetical protein [Bacteroidota bacterium]